jgi:ABC-2 type transport system permease protein
MLTPFRYTLRRLRGQIIGWGLGLAMLGLIIVPFYDVFLEQQAEFMELMANYPPELLAFFGDASDPTAIARPEGYLNYYFFSILPVIIGIFGISAGSSLLAADEEAGRLDLILAHPISRAKLFGGRLLAFVAAALVIMFVGWLGCAIPLGASSLGLSAGRIGVAFLPLLAQLLIYGALALCLSMLLPARRLAGMAAGLVMVASYLLSSLGSLHSSLASIARFLPHDHYQGGDAIRQLDVETLLGLLIASVVLAGIAWWRFSRRDVRVAGEGSWGLPSIPRLRRVRAEQ